MASWKDVCVFRVSEIFGIFETLKRFSLFPTQAYGGKLLLHNTRLFLKCGRRYGICGKNGVGKTTLMRNIANGKIDGLASDLISVFVESHADDEGEEGEWPVLKWTTLRPELASPPALVVMGRLLSVVLERKRGALFFFLARRKKRMESWKLFFSLEKKEGIFF